MMLYRFSHREDRMAFNAEVIASSKDQAVVALVGKYEQPCEPDLAYYAYMLGLFTHQDMQLARRWHLDAYAKASGANFESDGGRKVALMQLLDRMDCTWSDVSMPQVVRCQATDD